MKCGESRRLGPLVFRDPVLLCVVLYTGLYFDAGGFLRLGLLAAVLHECGHILAYILLFRRFPVIEVTMTGLCMRLREAERYLPPFRLFMLAAAGPAVNLLLAGGLELLLAQHATVWAGSFWAANLLTGIFNLLPIPPLDGAQMLACLSARKR